MRITNATWVAAAMTTVAVAVALWAWFTLPAGGGVSFAYLGLDGVRHHGVSRIAVWPLPLIASSSASLARNGGASAIAVASSSVTMEKLARVRYGATRPPSVRKRRRVIRHDQSPTWVPRSCVRWLPAW